MFYIHLQNLHRNQGRIQDFVKEGAPKLRTDRTLVPVGTGGVWGGCALSEAEKICNFQSYPHDLVHSFSLGRQHKVRHPYLCKK